MTNHVRFVDGLRGIAVLMVFLFHVNAYGLLPNPMRMGGFFFDLPLFAFITQGSTGVDLFFFLSGFALFYPYAQHLFEARPLQTLAHYADRRIAKIVPSYVLVLTFMALIHPHQITSSDSLFSHWARHLLFIHIFWLDSFGSIVGPLWTLAVEVQFYLIFPIIARYFMRSPFWTLVILVVISNVYRHIVNADSHELGLRWFLLIGQLPAYLDLFGFGSFAAYIIVQSRSKPQPQSRFGTNAWTIVACLSGVMFYIFLSTIEHTANSLLWLTQTRSLLGLTFLSLCVGIDRGASPLRHVLENPVLLWFSYVSYNLYLWNDNILEWYRNNVPSVFSSIPDGDTLNAFFIMSIPICIAWAVTHWIETPLLRTGVFAYIARLRAREIPA